MTESKRVPDRNTTVMYGACLVFVCMLLGGPTVFKAYVNVTHAPFDRFLEASQGVLSRTHFSSPEDKAIVAQAFSLGLLYVPITMFFSWLYAAGLAAAGWIAYREFMLPAPTGIAAEKDGE
jgi:hypothetical protein